ncbi:hypothetical protein BMR07_05025, partial [Methylococcaceae bacterium CS1]
MIRYFILHPTAANLLMGLLIIMGLVTLPTLKRETFPEIKHYEIEVKIMYPGATPRKIEQKICKPLENTIDGTSYIDEMRCESRQSMAVAAINMQEQGDFVQFNNDIRSAVDEQARHATSRNSGTPVAIIRSPTQRMGDALNALRPQRLRTKAASSLLPHWLDGYSECNSCSSRVLLAHVESANCPVAYQGLKITTSLSSVSMIFS